MREPPPSQSRPERGTAAGAIVFGLVLAGVAVGGFLWLEGRRNRLAPTAGTTVRVEDHTADKWTGRLGGFLAKGPSGGTWEIRYLSGVYKQYLAPHPSREEFFLIAQVNENEVIEARAVSRWLVPRQFFRAPPALFFSNYMRSQGPVEETLPDGTETVRVHWVPRVNNDGLTERRVWFSVAEGEVVQVEDRSREGRVVKRVRRLSVDTEDWDPRTVDEASLNHCQVEPPDPTADPDRVLHEVAAAAPFPVFEPSYLPPGYVLVRSSYSSCDAARSAAGLQGVPPEEVMQTPVHLVTQLYSDGMALISLAIAPRRDMDAIENATAGMGDESDPDSCPGLPANPRDIRQESATIRMRTDVCRSVLRLDDLDDVSVTLMGRNEIPGEEYLRMMGGLRPVVGDPHPK